MINLRKKKNNTEEVITNKPYVLLTLPTEKEIINMAVNVYRDWTGAEDRKVFIKIGLMMRDMVIERDKAEREEREKTKYRGIQISEKYKSKYNE